MKILDSVKPDPIHVQHHMRLCRFLPMWTVYRPTTKDYPGKWLARMFLTIPTSQATNILIIADSLEEVRASLPPGLFKLGRHEQDDPVIEETWM